MTARHLRIRKPDVVRRAASDKKRTDQTMPPPFPNQARFPICFIYPIPHPAAMMPRPGSDASSGARLPIPAFQSTIGAQSALKKSSILAVLPIAKNGLPGYIVTMPAASPSKARATSVARGTCSHARSGERDRRHGARAMQPRIHAHTPAPPPGQPGGLSSPEPAAPAGRKDGGVRALLAILDAAAATKPRHRPTCALCLRCEKCAADPQAVCQLCVNCTRCHPHAESVPDHDRNRDHLISIATAPDACTPRR